MITLQYIYILAGAVFAPGIEAGAGAGVEPSRLLMNFLTASCETFKPFASSHWHTCQLA